MTTALIMDEVSIEFCLEKDIDSVGLLWLDMVNEMMPNEKPRMDWWLKIAKHLYGTGMYSIVIARYMERIIGFIDYVLFPEPSTGEYHGVAQCLYVVPEYRNKKRISFNMVRMAIRNSKIRGAKKIEFFVMHDDQKKWIRRGYYPYRTMMRRNHV